MCFLIVYSLLYILISSILRKAFAVFLVSHCLNDLGTKLHSTVLYVVSTYARPPPPMPLRLISAPCPNLDYWCPKIGVLSPVLTSSPSALSLLVQLLATQNGLLYKILSLHCINELFHKPLTLICSLNLPLTSGLDPLLILLPFNILETGSMSFPLLPSASK